MDSTAIDENIPDVSLTDDSTAVQAEPSNTEEVAAPGPDTQADADTTDGQTPEGEQAPTQKEGTPAQDQDAQRRHNAEMAARRVQERHRVKQDVANQLDETYGPKTEEELRADGMNVRDAQLEALRQEIAYKEQRTQIAEMNASMQSDAVNVMNDFPVFNPNSQDFNPEFTQMVEQQYRLASRLQTDDNGIILNAEVPLYDYYQQMAMLYQKAADRGASQGQADAMNMMSRTEDPGGAGSNHSGDSLDELEERLGNTVIT